LGLPRPVLWLRRGRGDGRDLLRSRLRGWEDTSTSDGLRWGLLSGVAWASRWATLFHVGCRLLWLLGLLRRRRIGVLGSGLRDHSWLVLGGIIYGRRRHVGYPGVGSLMCHVGSQTASIVAGYRARANGALRSVAALLLLSVRMRVRMAVENGTIGDGR